MTMNPNEEKFINTVNEKYGTGVYLFDKMVYINAHKQVELYCVEGGHYFKITPMQIVRSTAKGCNICQKNTAYTTETFIEKVKTIHPTLSFEKTIYKRQRDCNGKVTVTCHNDPNDVHDWEVSAATLLKGKTSCGICSGKGGRSTERFIELVSPIHNHKYDYSLVDYKTSDEHVDIICPEHGVFKQIPKSHMAGRGCPSCGEYGYQPSKPGYFYVQKLSNNSKVVYKYGITGDMKRRIHEQSRDSDFEHTVLVERYFEDGNKPLLLEKFIKQYIESGVVSTEELPSGFTETFDVKYLESVLEIVNTFK